MEDTPKTQDSTESPWQERALKAEAELAKALQKLEYLEAQMRFDPPFWENICLVFQLSHGCPLFRPPSLLV